MLARLRQGAFARGGLTRSVIARAHTSKSGEHPPLGGTAPPQGVLRSGDAARRRGVPGRARRRPGVKGVRHLGPRARDRRKLPRDRAGDAPAAIAAAAPSRHRPPATAPALPRSKLLAELRWTAAARPRPRRPPLPAAFCPRASEGRDGRGARGVPVRAGSSARKRAGRGGGAALSAQCGGGGG